MTVESLIKNENKQRKQAIKKLNSYLTNPGRFSILVIGLRGTGKAHWLSELQKLQNKPSLNLNSITFINALNANMFAEEDWIKTFKNTNNGLLVISDIEELTKKNQAVLFEGISTGEGGKFGFKEKEYAIRIAFTTTKSISSLRDSETYLTHKFFDRICQFAVKFPSYHRGDRNIWQDFKKTWKKMCFKEYNSLPGEAFKEWLENGNIILHGNFRDLDKLAINWHNYRLQEDIDEENILELVKSDFNDFYRFPEHNVNLKREFEISEDINWNDNLDNFKEAYTRFIKERYGSLKQGAKKAGISYRTMERWANGKGKKKEE
ncbi:sigma 54-interacting transcriptional regulator [Algibacter lectus]|uniref:sigma 54-interacting transcriptional regulator n=1 Tax=Algibacter lectus TaxID=221126 RepID=UPI002493E5AD|nr:sigma 54-interacting transcriptional regulator [Algibacter lectus]